MFFLSFLMQSEEPMVISFPSLKDLVACILFLHVWKMFQQHGLINTDNLGIATVLKSPVASSHQKHKFKKTEMLSSCPRIPTSVMKTCTRAPDNSYNKNTRVQMAQLSPPQPLLFYI